MRLTVAALAILALLAAGCSTRRDDGLGDLWKGVQHVLKE